MTGLIEWILSFSIKVTVQIESEQNKYDYSFSEGRDINYRHI